MLELQSNVHYFTLPMKQFRLPIFSSQIKIYSLHIVPIEPVYAEVVNIKKQFEDEFGKQPLSRSKPHVAVAGFQMNSKYQEALMAAFDQLKPIEKFKLRLEGYMADATNSNALSLKVADSENLDRLQNRVREICNEQLQGKIKAMIVSKNPQLVISKTSGQKMLQKSLAHFQKVGYEQDFEVGELLLVARSKYRAWDWHHQIKLSKSKQLRAQF